jgi:hypothetical protein
VVAAVSALWTRWTAPQLSIKVGYSLQLLLDILSILRFLKLSCFIGGFGGKGFGSKPHDDDERRGILYLFNFRLMLRGMLILGTSQASNQGLKFVYKMVNGNNALKRL